MEEGMTEQKGAEPSRTISQEALDGEDLMAMLQRRHMFHLACVHEWAVMQIQEGQLPQCPMRR